ncbi:MAG: calcium-binding protein, partial [Actinobacteria bacterium]
TDYANTHDALAAGNDTVYGDGGNDVVFGDHGVITQVAGTNRILTTGSVLGIAPTLDAQGGNDTIYGNDGADILLGQTGNDMVDGGAGNDLVFGDNATLDRSSTLGDITSPLFRQLSGGQIYNLTTGVSNAGTAWQVDPQGSSWWSDFRVTLVDIGTGAPAGTSGNDYLAGGAGNDIVFGENGNDVVQGDGSTVGALNTLFSHLVGACRDATNALFVNPSVDSLATDGNDYIEGGAGNDTVFGNLGQDNIVGGSSNLFGQTTQAMRPDGSNLLFGGSGTAISYDNVGDTSANGHANDSDAIVANNGLIFDLVGPGGFLSFYYVTRVIARVITVIDYLEGNPDTPLVIGGPSEIHGEAGDDFLYGGAGNDVIYGDGQNDAIVGGRGNDWISGGNGDDGILGDDGRILASTEGTAEPLNGIAALTDSADGLTTTLTAQGTGQQVVVNPVGTLVYTAFLIPYDLGPTPQNANDIIYGGLGNDWLVGGTGRDSLFGGMGNDVMNADDNLNTVNGTNRGTDTSPSYEDFVYGGGGRDVLIANTGGDRLIDWGGEYNSFLVPFDPFGMATVDRAQAPAVQNMIVALALSEGADPLLGTGALAEIGQSIDHGGPRDPQPGNSHGSRDVLRSAGVIVFDTPVTPGSGAATVAAAPAFIAPTVLDPTVPVNVAMPLTITGPVGTVADWTITDPLGHTIKGEVTLGATGAITLTVNVATLGDGVLSSSVLETDTNGNTETVAGSPWLKDTTPPKVTVSLATPNNGTSYDVGTPITLTVAATDGGSGIASTVSSNSGSTIDVDSLTAGAHTVTITSTDKAGNTTTVTVTFQVHATLTGLVKAVNDIAILQSAMSGNSAHAKLPSFISAVQSASGKTIAAAYATLLLSWANDLLSRT